MQLLPNKYRGYVKIPKKKAYRKVLSLNFNPAGQIQGKASKLDGFWLRLFVPDTTSKSERIELGIKLRPEEWLDLIDAMKEQFELMQEALKEGK